jgi:hypothetical protein
LEQVRGLYFTDLLLSEDRLNLRRISTTRLIMIGALFGVQICHEKFSRKNAQNFGDNGVNAVFSRKYTRIYKVDV